MEGLDDRRPQIFDISSKHRCDKSYFATLSKYLNSDLGDKFYSFLMNRDITYEEFMLKPIPSSKTKNIIYEISTGHNIYLEFVNYFKDLNPEIGEVVASQFLADFKMYCSKNGLNIQVSAKKFSDEMNKLWIKKEKKHGHIKYILYV